MASPENWKYTDFKCKFCGGIDYTCALCSEIESARNAVEIERLQRCLTAAEDRAKLYALDAENMRLQRDEAHANIKRRIPISLEPDDHLTREDYLEALCEWWAEQGHKWGIEIEKTRAFARRAWWALAPVQRWTEGVPDWINDGRLPCGCEVNGHKCCKVGGGCGNCVEHCVCDD